MGRETRMLAVCRTLNLDARVTYYEPFNDTPMSATHWEHLSWTLDSQASTGLPLVTLGVAEVLEGLTRTAALVDKNASVITQRECSIECSTMLVGSIISILMDMNDTTPATAASLRLKLTRIATSTWTVSVLKNETVLQSHNVTISTGILRLVVDNPGAGRVRGYFASQSTPDVMQGLSSYTPAGSRVGFALKAPTGTAFTDSLYFSHTYMPETAAQPSKMLCASANGMFYRETTLCTLAKLSTSLTLRSDRLINAVNRLEKLFIADYGLRVQVTGGTSSGTAFADAGVASWSALGVDADDDRLEIYAAPAGTALGVYGIFSVAAGSLTLASSPGNNSSISYRIVRGPKVYDAATDALTLVGLGTIAATDGAPHSQFPIGCRHFSLWADRIVACNDPLNPQSWYMSAQGYPFLWDYGDTGTFDENSLTTGTIITGLGEEAAISPNSLAQTAGKLGDWPICTIPIRDDLLLFGCDRNFYFLRGNPLAGGQFNRIPGDHVGILDIGAYCWTPTGRLFVMTLDGLYEVTMERMVPISRVLLPAELLGIDPEQYEVTMGYDVERVGILIACVSRDLTANPTLAAIYYFYDLRTEGFFPEDRADSDHDPLSMVGHEDCGNGKRILLLGGRDGYIRKYDDDAQNDDGVLFDSNVFYGPVRLGNGEYGDGYLHEIVDVLDAESGSITLKAHTGYSAQVAKSATSRYQTAMSAGRNRNRHPRLRGGALYLETVGVPGSAWVRESLTITRERAGKLTVV